MSSEVRKSAGHGGCCEELTASWQRIRLERYALTIRTQGVVRDSLRGPRTGDGAQRVATVLASTWCPLVKVPLALRTVPVSLGGWCLYRIRLARICTPCNGSGPARELRHGASDRCRSPPAPPLRVAAGWVVGFVGRPGWRGCRRGFGFGDRGQATKSGHRSIHLDRGPAEGRRKGFTKTDYARPLDAAHQQLGGPVALVWDNLNTHVSRRMRKLIEARLRLTVYQLPPYAPAFNPVEGVWSHLKPSLAHLTKHSLDQAHRAGEDPAQTDAAPTRPHRRPHRQDRPRLPTAVTSAIEDP
ncbi:transposase [Streptomyces sp. NPDC049687]|uniref:transposase n=1 Tax=Streptomyces sp. NPDC049687 TaxID=3365596 RepID=UPI0037AD1EBD